jgi:hypothetical protein
MRTSALLIFLFATAPALASDVSFEQAKSRADRDEQSLSSTQTHQLIASQARAGGEAHSTCIASNPKPNLSPYTVVMQVDASGNVVRTWLHGQSSLAICVNKELSHKTLFTPPRAPFFTSFEMTWQP